MATLKRNQEIKSNLVYRWWLQNKNESETGIYNGMGTFEIKIDPKLIKKAEEMYTKGELIIMKFKPVKKDQQEFVECYYMEKYEPNTEYFFQLYLWPTHWGFNPRDGYVQYYYRLPENMGKARKDFIENAAKYIEDSFYRAHSLKRTTGRIIKLDLDWFKPGDLLALEQENKFLIPVVIKSEAKPTSSYEYEYCIDRALDCYPGDAFVYTLKDEYLNQTYKQFIED